MDSTRSVGEKFKVHVSFTEADQNFANRLLTALGGLGCFELSVTPVGDAPAMEWTREADGLIAAADAVVFVLSPAVADAPAVAREAELALEMSKRMLAVFSQPTSRADLPPSVEDIKPIPMDSEQAYKRNLKLLVQSLKQDDEWIRRHTELYARARKWQASRHDPGLLLAMPEVIAAKAWTFERPDKAPKPTDLHIDFIRASEEPETAPQHWPAEDLAGEAGAGKEPTPGVARRTASRFAALLRPKAKHKPASVELEPVELEPVELAPVELTPVELAPDATLEVEPPPVLETEVKAEPLPLPDEGAEAEPPEIPETSAEPVPRSEPSTAVKPEPLLSLDEWLGELPAALPAYVARSRPAVPQPDSGLDLNRLAYVSMALNVSGTPAGRTQPYCAPVTAAAAPIATPDDTGGNEDHGRTNGHAPVPPMPGAKPLAVHRRTPAPGTCPVAPRPALRQVAPEPAQRAPMLVRSTAAPAPKPCSPRAIPTPAKSGPVAGSPPAKPGMRPVALAPAPGARPPTAKLCVAAARSGPTAVDPAEHSIAPAVDKGAPAVRRGAAPPAARPMMRPAAQQGVIADAELESLLTSYLAGDEDTLEFR